MSRKSPLDFIKLHESLSHDLKYQPDKQRYIATLIAFSHRLGHPVVASGINNEEDFTNLKALGCDLIQGALWLKPMSLKEVDNRWCCSMKVGNMSLSDYVIV